jgi:type III secretory pathway component EscS
MAVVNYRRRWTVVAGASPLAIVGLLYLHVAVVRVFLGKLPDPDSLPQPLYAWDVFATVTILAMYPLTVIALIGLLLSVFASLRHFRNPCAAFLIAAVFVVLVIALDPGGGLSWIMD